MKKLFVIFILLQIPIFSIFALDIPSDIITLLQSYIGKSVTDLPSGTSQIGNSEYALIVQQFDNPPALVGLGFMVQNNCVVQAVYQFISGNNQEINVIHSNLLKIMEPYGQSQRSGDVLYWYIEKGFMIVISKQSSQDKYAVSIKISEI